ncbi:helix-turn-helix domain-containing protein [Streptomyces sp. NPDC005349]|uniref:helix-turn-helix domain-containing protein n=1 Tax=Streptomyces sp. NPDC005349 TaxID=3157037 RepID=UPI0033A9A6A6
MRQQILVVAFEPVRLSSLGAVTDAMAFTDRYRDRVYGGHAFYPSDHEVTGIQVRVLTPTGGPVRTAAGTRLVADGRTGGDTVAKAVVLPAFGIDDAPWRAAERTREWPTVLSWLTAQHDGGALIAAAGASVLVLAEAGLLDGRAAVADPDTARHIHARRPGTCLLPGLPMTASRDVLTAATAAGERQLVRELVRRVNSSNVLCWLDEALGQDQERTGSLDPLVARFVHLARERFAEPGCLQAISADLRTTERTLRRRCRTALGETPGAVVRVLRLDAARVMLSRSSIPVERVGVLVGYRDVAAFRAQFRRRFGCSPSAARRADAGRDSSWHPRDETCTV